MTPIKIRIAAELPDLRAELRQAVADALLGEERAAATFFETRKLTGAAHGKFEPSFTAAEAREAGAAILLDGVAATGKSTLAARIVARLKRIRRQDTLIATRVA